MASSIKCFEAYRPKLPCRSSYISLLLTTFFKSPNTFPCCWSQVKPSQPFWEGAGDGWRQLHRESPTQSAQGISSSSALAALAAPSPRQHQCRVKHRDRFIITQTRQILKVKEWGVTALLSKPKIKAVAITFLSIPLLPAAAEFQTLPQTHLEELQSLPCGRWGNRHGADVTENQGKP